MVPALTEDFIRKSLRKAYRPGTIAAADRPPEYYENVRLKCAAVLIPLAWWQEQWQLVFTRRTETVEHHKGQVSFPGGGCEIQETTPEETALREAYEEIGLEPENVCLLGKMNDILTITGYRVTPVVGIIGWPFEIRLEIAEVGRVFMIPLSWLAGRQNWEERPFTPTGTHRPVPVITYHEYDGEILWGATARITHNFLVSLGLL
jgi:8-oxo-dGTP pyrophosphatase MutT (NUDIX family)